MKKIKIPFTLKEYNTNNYEIETKDGRKTRILCSDFLEEDKKFILAAITQINTLNDKTCEIVKKYDLDGISVDMIMDLNLYLVKYEFENGDIVVGGNYDYPQISVFKHYDDEDHSIAIIYNMYSKDKFILNEEVWCSAKYLRLATANEKKEFFDALEKINKPKTTNVKKKSLNYLDVCLMKNDNDLWCLCQYSNIRTDGKFTAVGGNTFKYCIPFNEDIKHLLGKTDDVPKKYEK